MVTKGLIVRLEARAGKEDEVAAFLRDAVALVDDEPQTIAWVAARLGASTFAIVDVFPDEDGRRAHLEGPGRASSLFDTLGTTRALEAAYLAMADQYRRQVREPIRVGPA
jgi:quinol monooxygenase YgiN